MTPEQLSEIRQYLLSRRLSLDVLLEVEDHFVTQVGEMMKAQDLSFAEAFSRTKSAWLKDLKMTYNVFYSADDISPLMIKYQKQAMWNILRKVFPLTILAIVFYMVTLYYFNAIVWFQIELVVMMCITFIMWMKNRKALKIKKQYKVKPLTVYDGLVVHSFSYLGALLVLRAYFFNDSLGLTDYSTGQFLMSILVGGYFNYLCLQTMFVQHYYVKELRKIQRYYSPQ